MSGDVVPRVICIVAVVSAADVIVVVVVAGFVVDSLLSGRHC